MRGRFITFEGIDGCGKTTQAERLIRRLRSQGYTVVFTREPGGTEIAEQIRALVLDAQCTEMTDLTELLLYMASRAQHTKELIQPSIEAGHIVVSDRYADATVAYQGYGRGLDLDIITTLNRIATGGVWPDLTVLLDIPPLEAARRRRKMNEVPDRLEREERAFHTRVRAGYLTLAEQDPNRFLVLDGTASIPCLERHIDRAVLKLLEHNI